MRKNILAAILVPLAAIAQENTCTGDQSVEFRWQHPTTRVDGTPLRVDEIWRYVMYCTGWPESRAVPTLEPQPLVLPFGEGNFTCTLQARAGSGDEGLSDIGPENSVDFVIPWEDVPPPDPTVNQKPRPPTLMAQPRGVFTPTNSPQ